MADASGASYVTAAAFAQWSPSASAAAVASSAAASSSGGTWVKYSRSVMRYASHGATVSRPSRPCVQSVADGTTTTSQPACSQHAIAWLSVDDLPTPASPETTSPAVAPSCPSACSPSSSSRNLSACGRTSVALVRSFRCARPVSPQKSVW